MVIGPEWFNEEFFQEINEWFIGLAQKFLESFDVDLVLSPAAKTTLENALLACALHYNVGLTRNDASRGLKIFLAYTSLLVFKKEDIEYYSQKEEDIE